MTVDGAGSPLIELSQQRAVELFHALDAREAQIKAEGLHRRLDPVLPPYPGCPECSRPAESTAWAVIEIGDLYELMLDVDPCGHRFRADWEPILTVDSDEHGTWWREDIWP
jgi:hypothetical protein